MSDFKASVHKTQLGKLADPLAVFKGPTSEGKEEEEGREGKGRAKGGAYPSPKYFGLEPLLERDGTWRCCSKGSGGRTLRRSASSSGRV